MPEVLGLLQRPLVKLEIPGVAHLVAFEPVAAEVGHERQQARLVDAGGCQVFDRAVGRPEVGIDRFSGHSGAVAFPLPLGMAHKALVPLALVHGFLPRLAKPVQDEFRNAVFDERGVENLLADQRHGIGTGLPVGGDREKRRRGRFVTRALTYLCSFLC